MTNILRRIFGFVLCFIGICLPFRLRIWFSELLGWTFQSLYLAYFSIIKFIIRKLNGESVVS